MDGDVGARPRALDHEGTGVARRGHRHTVVRPGERGKGMVEGIGVEADMATGRVVGGEDADVAEDAAVLARVGSALRKVGVVRLEAREEGVGRRCEVREGGRDEGLAGEGGEVELEAEETAQDDDFAGDIGATQVFPWVGLLRHTRAVSSHTHTHTPMHPTRTV